MDDQNILLVDKPEGWTSFDVVAKIRGMIRASYQANGQKPTKRQLKVGHAGTLDPFATGLLIVLIGDATKRAQDFLKLDKVYEATIHLGATSTTGDPEGEITSNFEFRISNFEETTAQHSVADRTSNIEHRHSNKSPSETEIRTMLQSFTGPITQTPPIYSAIKVGGVKAYEAAHKGKTLDIPPRQVTIYTLELIDYTYPNLRVRAHVSSGTYIRTLAEDIGRALGTGAYCSQLRRLQIGGFSINDAMDITEVNIDKL